MNKQDSTHSFEALSTRIIRYRRRVMPRRKLVSIIGTIAISAFSVLDAGAQEPHQQVRFVPDVVGQFNALTTRPDAMGFHIGDGPDPSQCRHHQALIRTAAADGTPYFIVSRSGPPRDFCIESIDPIHVGNPIANLYVVRMGSRDTQGERLRSNRLRRDLATSSTPPEADDRVVRSIPYDGSTADWPHYDHPGGMQQVGNIVALGVEFPARIFVGPGPDDWVQEDPGAPPVLVQFLDVTDPENPRKKSTFVPPQLDARAGVVALTPCGAGRTGMPCPSGRYLLALTGGNNSRIDFYVSTATEDDGSTDLARSNLSWTWLDKWEADPGVDCQNFVCTPRLSDDEGRLGVNWPTDDAHQGLQFLREGNLNGALYLAGARGAAFGDDFIDLYRVDLESSEVRLTWVSSRHKISHPAGEGESAGPEIADFRAGSAFHVTPSGELLFYATEHDNDGPAEEVSNGRGSVKMGEWRHIDMVRPNSPALAPTVEVGGPYVVDEGGSVVLSASGRPPITKAWIQLFEDPDYSQRYVTVDYSDRYKDNFDDFERLDPGFFGDVNGATDEASSWRWFAPFGCTLRVNEHSFGDSRFPGIHKTFFGTGRVQEEPDLHTVPDDYSSGSMNDNISSMQFFANCDAYYNAAIGVAWDFDLNGVFETIGQNPIFSAAELDGPSVRSVLVRAQHPTDETSLGHSAPVTVEIRVRNVPPNIASFALVDSLGLKVGADVPFALVNLEYAAAGSFTDPGKPDHQTATLNFGDGPSVPSSTFDVFSDAFGGVTGQLRKGHSYGAPGTYAIRLEVTDDDGGLTPVSRSVTVVSPIEALQSIVNQIDLLLSGSPNSRVIAALRDARNNLAGNPNGNPRNGALQELANGDLVAALVKIKAAITALERAEAAGGGNLSALKYLLGLTGESIAQGVYLNAVAAVGSPSPGQAAQLQRIRQAISDGHARLLSGDYVGAIDLFKDAVGRALSLL
jgi:hypothetical protein